MSRENTAFLTTDEIVSVEGNLFPVSHSFLVRSVGREKRLFPVTHKVSIKKYVGMFIVVNLAGPVTRNFILSETGEAGTWRTLPPGVSGVPIRTDPVSGWIFDAAAFMIAWHNGMNLQLHVSRDGEQWFTHLFTRGVGLQRIASNGRIWVRTEGAENTLEISSDNINWKTISVPPHGHQRWQEVNWIGGVEYNYSMENSIQSHNSLIVPQALSFNEKDISLLDNVSTL